ncbi:MAG: hypothetical protein LBU65_09740 [Planctomycetaceae bacterium]|nr:hypothetical protein [Planctomycetaceae bacterium]
MFWENWDIIGVNDVPSAIDEYDSYADEMAEKMISSSVDESLVREYLYWVAFEHM